MIPSSVPIQFATEARSTPNSAQKKWLIAMLACVCAGIVWKPDATVRLIAVLVTAFYLASVLYKFALVFFGVTRKRELAVSPEQIASLDEKNLPVYTVLVPLYKETRILPQTISAISGLDYPSDKLDVKFLIEQDDRAMQQALATFPLPEFVEVVIVPDTGPKTKPRACNAGLCTARGEFLVIYDAEDIPDADQLKKSASAFRSLCDERIICLQAKLNYYNPRQNILTRWFTAEYSTWFDLYLPGIDYFGAPIPLGGTSNHFRTAQLREIGGWDPYNVAEDCDLGIRLFRAGYRTRILDSTTWEEANSHINNWMRQRSRWVKGYIQTALVHYRRPVALLREMGVFNAASFKFTVFGHVFTLLVNPAYWVITLVWIFTHLGEPISTWCAPGSSSLVTFALFFSNFIFVFLNMLGCVRRKYPDLVKESLISPVYWVLMSVGAWKGFLQLFTRPHYWEKTEHGLVAKETMGPATST